MGTIRTLIVLQLCLLTVSTFELSATNVQGEWQAESNQTEYIDDSEQL